MSGHEQFGEELALYALNALEGPEREVLEKHLATCAGCRLELEQLRGDGALLAMSTMGPRPPARARQRLLDAVAKEAATTPTLAQSARKDGAAIASSGSGRHWWGWLGWAATAAVIVFAASLWKENVGLKESLASAKTILTQNSQDLADLRRIAAPIVDPQAQRVTLVSMKAAVQPQGKAFYLKNRASLVFVADNMPTLPPQKAFELWLIPTQGAPIPAGVFKPDAHGRATVVNPPLPGGVEAKAFAITVENEAGATTPTMPIVMMGTGE
jgi:hypothetical protein